jgi:hypothetical protein
VFEAVADACRQGKKLEYSEAKHRFGLALIRLKDEDAERLRGAKSEFWRYVLAADDERNEN